MGVNLLPQLREEQKTRKRYYVKEWQPQHRMVVALYATGMSHSEIAERVGMHKGYVSQILNDPRAEIDVASFGAAVADRVVDTGVRLKLYANEALDEIVEELRESRDVKVRQRAAFGILDRAGYSPAKIEERDGRPVLPESVVRRMEEATKEIIASRADYENVDPQTTDATGADSATETETDK